MGTFALLGILAAVLVVASALGRFWAPALLAVGFGAWGFLLLTSSLSGILPLLGIGFVGAAALELVAAHELFGEPDAGRRRDWRLGSAFLGLTVSVAAFASLVYVAAAIMASLFI